MRVRTARRVMRISIARQIHMVEIMLNKQIDMV